MMSEHEKLLEAARSAMGVLATVLGRELGAEAGQSPLLATDDDQYSPGITDMQPTRETVLHSTVNHQGHSSPSRMKTSITLSSVNGPTSYGENRRNSTFNKSVSSSTTKPLTNNEADYRVKEVKYPVDRRLGQARTNRVPSQVAKVTPQRLIASESRDDITGDHSAATTEWRNVDEGERYDIISVERALASNVLVLENAKLREELAEIKTELATLKLEVAMKMHVSKQNAAVQTYVTDLREFCYPGQRAMDEMSSDEDADYTTTFSNSSAEMQFLPRRTVGRSQTSTDGNLDTPALTMSTPGTLGRASTVSSSGGGLVRRKLELPKSLMKEPGYMSLTSYEDSCDESPTQTTGCCPCLCFRASWKESRV